MIDFFLSLMFLAIGLVGLIIGLYILSALVSLGSYVFFFLRARWRIWRRLRARW